MHYRHLLCSVAFTLLIQTSAVAQPTGVQESAKTAKSEAQAVVEQKALALLEEALADAQSLKQIVNRLRVHIGAADLVWPYDENRARALFEKSIKDFTELVGNIDATDPAYYNYIQGPNQLHGEILQILVKRDPQMALDFLHQARVPRPPQPSSKYAESNHEVQMELQLASQILWTNPKLALQTALDSLDKGISSNVVGVLTHLQEKDRDGAARLANALIKKLLAEDLTTNQEAANVTINLLNLANRMEAHGSTSDGKTLVTPNLSPLVDTSLTGT